MAQPDAALFHSHWQVSPAATRRNDKKPWASHENVKAVGLESEPQHATRQQNLKDMGTERLGHESIEVMNRTGREPSIPEPANELQISTKAGPSLIEEDEVEFLPARTSTGPFNSAAT